MPLHNRISRELLKSRLMEENFSRKTLSFYRYYYLDDPDDFRNTLYREWFDLNCFGRIYIAKEGINAQLSVPEYNLDAFYNNLRKYPIFDQMDIKYAIEDNGKSFYKLTMKVRQKLVADGLNDDAYDVTNVGKHLSAEEFHELVELKDTIVVDMRNHYESEIGHFKNAICPKTDTFREEITMVADLLADKKDQKIILYCTGGIRCEKASAYLKHHGFKDVNQLHGGILEYARRIKQLNLSSNFIGKNFVFDERLGEAVSEHVISHCHQCGKPCDNHVNCTNNLCHILFIQCKECANKFDNCCSKECCDVKNGLIDKEEYQKTSQRKFGNKHTYRKSFTLIHNESSIGSFSNNPDNK